MYSDNLKSSVAASVGNSNTFSGIYNAQGIELDTLFANIDDINAQFDIDTATWGLDIYEKELGIKTDYTKIFDYRRSVIKSKNRGNGKLDATMIKIVCDSFTNGNVDVTFDGIIHIKFNSIIGIPPNLSDLKVAVEQIKPAYILLEYLFSYLLIKDIDQVMTINQLQLTTLNNFAGGA